MKRLLLSLLFISAVFYAGAQDRVSTYTARLRTPDPMTSAQVSVSNDPDVASGLRTASKGDRIDGYRVCIFFENSQNGRNMANGALGTFRSKFPGIPGEVIYANPTFKAVVGYCLTLTEATILQGRVREIFPKAFLFHEQIPIQSLVRSSVVSLPGEEAVPNAEAE